MGNAVFPYIAGGAAIVVAAILSWAVLIHGPSQFQAGATQALARADKATKEASNDLSNAAEAARLAFAVCTDTGGVYEFSNGECKR